MSATLRPKPPHDRSRRVSRRRFLGVLGAAASLPAAGALLGSCNVLQRQRGAGLGASADEIIKQRKLAPEDVTAALMTYMPSGKHDEYLMFSSTGHGGQVLVHGLPSMRLLKVIAVFVPEPWQGYGYGGSTDKVLEGGFFRGRPITWGDTHHPALSETNGEYDGQFLFINDKANGRVAVIDLRDFETKQIVRNPLLVNEHGGCFVTPNTDYVLEADQYPVPLGGEYAPLSEYKEKYRGVLTFWKFDRQKGRIVPEASFAIETPPYWHDLADAGKGPSEGWAFWNSINTELAIPGILEGRPALEMSTAQRDMDYLHVVNWRKAEQVVAAGKYEEVHGFKLIRIETAVAEGLLYLIPEPKSPHGVDVAPRGDYIVVAGKLDPHVTVYSFEKIQQAIAAGQFDHDDYGIPILPFEQCVEAQVELGLGPLHTQFDDEGYAYTSLLLDSAVARWALGKPYRDDGWKLVEKLPVHYNIGHLAAVEGDTAKPAGTFLVTHNKWSVDRFTLLGPLLPQNAQLVDIRAGQPMRLLYDSPIGLGEPHYAQIIKAERIQAWEVYPEVGWNPETQSVDPNAVLKVGEERIERRGTTVEIWGVLLRSQIRPDVIEVEEGDEVIWHLTNIERAKDATHGFALGGYNVNLSLEPGEVQTLRFVADTPGTFPFYCTEFCSALHLEMMGYFLVKPKR
jgi:nitrous-oxide reductase